MDKLKLLIIAVLTVACLGGCVACLVGAGVAGGIAISKDSAKLEKDVSYDRAWRVTHDTLTNMGMVSLRDKQAGKIEAQVQGAKVNVTVSKITSSATRIKVKARKNLMPNVDLAIDILNQINNHL